MGCDHSDATVPIDKKAVSTIIDKKFLKVASLNYCGIMNSPYEFYCEEFEPELRELSLIFLAIVPQHIPAFTRQKFRWEFGKLDAKFRTGRYSPQFTVEPGIQNNKIISQERFEQRWDEVFDQQIGKVKVEYSEAERKALRQYDLIFFHTLLRYVYKITKLKEAEGRDATEYVKKLKPFYELSFLNEQKKLRKTISNFSKIEADVFFFQEYSQYFYEYLKERREHFISFDEGKDTLIIAKQSSFQTLKNIEDVLNKELKASLNWNNSSSFLCVDNYIFINAHLSSKEEKNRGQIEELKRGLLELKRVLKDYEIVVGGDLNSFLEPSLPFNKEFYMFPEKKDQLTTIKKRTLTQGQFHKGDKIVEESKDKIISTLKIEAASILYITGRVPKKENYVPCDEHPFDHFVVVTKLSKKQTK